MDFTVNKTANYKFERKIGIHSRAMRELSGLRSEVLGGTCLLQIGGSTHFLCGRRRSKKKNYE